MSLFLSQQKILINPSLIRDEFWIVKCIIGQSKKWWKNENGKKNDSRVKTWKGSLEQKRENFWSPMGEANRSMKGQRPDSIRSLYEVLYPFRNQRIWTSYSRMPSSEFLSLSRWVLTLVKLSYSQTTKMNLFKMLDFQRIHFSKKASETCHLFAQPNCEKKIFWARSSNSKSNAPFRVF